ncbi:MAG: O-antigen ligase family protein [Rikenellaceae bacterium]
MIYVLIGLLILAYSYNNYKQGFLWFLVFKIFLVTNITLISLPGVPLLTLEVFMTLVMIVLFFLKRHKIDLERHKFPFLTPFKWLAASYFLSTLFASIGFMGAVSAFVKGITTHLVTVYLMWMLIKDKRDILFLVKWFTIAFIPITLYAFYEYSIQSNPLMEYQVTLVADAERALDFTYDAERGRGYRVQSMFEHAIGAGINWAMFFILTFLLIFRYRWSSTKANLAVAVSIISLLAIFFTNSRASLVFIMIGSMAVVNFKNSKFYTYLLIGIGVILAASPLYIDYMNNLLSIFDSKVQASVGGSNLEMRLNQLDAAIALMKRSPIVGLGYKFQNVMSGRTVDALLGMESMWFRILTQFGLLGVVANSVLAYFSLYKIPRKFGSWPLFYISLAYWVTASATSVPGMLLYMYYMILIIIMKLHYIKQQRPCRKYQ